jgi:hypothetical protein
LGVAKSWSMNNGRGPGSTLRYGPLDEEVILLDNSALLAIEDDKPINRI